MREEQFEIVQKFLAKYEGKLVCMDITKNVTTVGINEYLAQNLNATEFPMSKDCFKTLKGFMITKEGMGFVFEETTEITPVDFDSLRWFEPIVANETIKFFRKLPNDAILEVHDRVVITDIKDSKKKRCIVIETTNKMAYISGENRIYRSGVLNNAEKIYEKYRETEILITAV